MAYEQMKKPEGFLYHYTKKESLDKILEDGKIRRMGDKECWFCTSLEDVLILMEQTVMLEGKTYYALGGIVKKYPTFVPEDYVILKLEPRYQNGDWVRWNQELPLDSPDALLKAARVFSDIKIGFRGDLKFRDSPEVIQVAPLILGQINHPTMSM